jgi:NAD(P)-dependent dehydrogenase (short-subunit alcohol dehydrogenase family)
MRILLLGSTGTLGSAIEAALAPRHEILGASRHSARRADLADEASLLGMLESCPPLDAVICSAGEVPSAPLADLGSETILSALRVKLLGQIALARLAMTRLADNGSITLTSGLLNHRPITMTACAAMANGALEGFVRAAALESVRGIRINLVSPGVLQESWQRYGAYFAGFPIVEAGVVAAAYVEAVEGRGNGQVLCVHAAP